MSYISRQRLREHLRAIRGRDRPPLCDLELAEFLPAVSPTMIYPHWLQPLADALERAELALEGGCDPVQLCVSVPPQHGKSTLILHWLSRLIGRRPEIRHAYCTYAQSLTRRQSRVGRRIAEAAAVPLVSRQLDDWVTAEGGGCAWTSIGGSLTGMPISGVGIIDDPTKDRQAAESLSQQLALWDWYTDTFLSRIHPRASQIVVATRWNSGDLTGRLLDAGGWELINLPAIDDTGSALWPEGRPLEWLEARRISAGEYGWASMYMGQPVPRGGALFDVAHTVRADQVPDLTRYSMGIDLAYAARTKSDYCAAVVLGWTREGVAYVVDVAREHASVQRFGRKIAEMSQRYACVPAWHATRQEEELSKLLFAEHQLRVDIRSVYADKFTRAQAASVAWNSGKIFTVRDRAWSQTFLHEIERFDGSPAQNDDQLDSFVSAFDSGQRADIRAPVVAGERVFSSPGSKWI